MLLPPADLSPESQRMKLLSEMGRPSLEVKCGSATEELMDLLMTSWKICIHTYTCTNVQCDFKEILRDPVCLEHWVRTPFPDMLIFTIMQNLQ